MAMKRLALNSNKLNVTSWLHILCMCLQVEVVINKKYFFFNLKLLNSANAFAVIVFVLSIFTARLNYLTT